MKAIIFSLTLLFISRIHAVAETATQQPLLTGNHEILSNSFRVIWGLLIVLGIILILYGLLRKRFSILSSLPDKEIKILEIKPLMGKKAICLVEIRGQEFLLGISEAQITNLALLPPKNRTSFSETLQQQSAEVKSGGVYG